MFCGKATAQTTFWTGEDSSSWADGNNWNPEPGFDGGEVDGLDSPEINVADLNVPVISTVDIPSLEIASLYLVGGTPGNSLLLNSSGGGSLQVDNLISVVFTGPSSITISVPISGEANLTDTGGGTLTLSGANTYSGGTSISSGTLVIGSSTVGPGSEVTQGPVGTGSLMLSAGTSLTTQDGSPYTLGNDITLCGGGMVTLLGGSEGANLTLSGMISGSSGLEIAPAIEGMNVVTLSSSGNSFSGGVTVDIGNTMLVVGASTSGSPGDLNSGPLGTGTLTLSSGNNFTTADGGSYTIDNDITLNGGGSVFLLGGSAGTVLNLGGMISGGSALEIADSTDVPNIVAFNSSDSTFSGGVTVDPGTTTLVIGNSSTGTGSNVTSGPFGTGTLALGDGTNLTTPDGNSYTIGNNINLYGGGSGRVYLLGSAGGVFGTSLELDGMITGSSILEIEAPNGESEDPNYVTLTSATSTFSGGVHVDSGFTNLFVGASSTGTGSGVTQGPLGTGTLMLSNDNDFETTGEGCVTIGNNIILCGGGTVYLENEYGGNMLTLSGMITGSSELDVGYGEETNYLALTSGSSTFSGGVSVENSETTLAIGANSTGTGSGVTQGPLGTGTLTLSNDNILTTVNNGVFTIGNNIVLSGEGTVNLLENSSGGGLTLGGTITGSSRIEVVASEGDTGNSVTLSSANSTFGGGVSVLSGNTTLAVGASSTGYGEGMTGPLGSGSLMLSDGNNFTTVGSGSFTIGNDINLCGEGTTTLLGGSSGTTLTLTGTITGAGALEVAAPGSGTNTLTLSSNGSSFSGGVTVDAGQNILVVGASAGEGLGPLGTGTLTMGNGTVLMTPAATPIVVTNNIVIGASGGPNSLYLGGVSSGILTLTGTISDYSEPGSLVLFGPVDFEGNNNYSGGTTINSTTVTVGTDSGLGYGQVTANSSTLNFTSGSPVIYNLSLNSASTVNFAAESTPYIVDMVGDTIGSGNVINLGSGTELSIQVDDDPKYFGTINGNGSLTLTSNSAGELDLENVNTYTGGTIVTYGALLVVANNQALGSGPVSLNIGSAMGVDHGITMTNSIVIPDDDVAIGGYGTINPSTPQSITIQYESGITGGRGTIGSGDSGHLIVGTLSFGANATLVLGEYGQMQFSIMNASGTPGTDFSQIAVAGTANITASAEAPFIIQLVGVDSTGLVVGTANSFNPNLPYTWTLLSAGTLSNFDASAFIVDSTTNFLNATNGGQFSVSESGNNLDLNFTPVPEPSTWALMAGGLFAAFGVAVRRRRRAV